MSLYIWGLDDGRSAIKATTSGEDEILIPNACVPYIRPMKSEKLSKEEIKPTDYLGIKCEEGTFVVGKGAIAQSSNLSWNGSNNKHKDINFNVIANASLGVMAGRLSGIHINPLVMGLTVDDDESEERHALLQSIMVREHNMTLIYPNGTQTNKKITVDQLIIKKQPLGTLFNMILDNSGKLVNENLAKGFNVIIDVGSRNVGVLTLDCLSVVSELSKSFNCGIHTAYDQVAATLYQQTGFRVPSGKMSAIALTKSVGSYDLTEMLEQAYRYLANDIINRINTLFIDSYQYVQNIILTGAGALVLKTYLENAFPLHPIYGGRFSTVKGFWKCGVREAIRAAGQKVTISLPSGASIVVGKKESA